MIDRKFEKYCGGPNVPPENRVHVSLAPTGRIFLSGLAYDLLGRPAAVNLYFSRADDQIAIEPAPNPQNADAMPILTQRRGRRINAAPFCRHFGIRVTATQRFIAPEKIGDALILKLSETVTVSAARGAGSRSSSNAQ
ncbi:MAG TPA: hypothetical protein VFZ49_10890 [Pyrinomonadaceae bacterium]